MRSPLLVRLVYFDQLVHPVRYPWCARVSGNYGWGPTPRAAVADAVRRLK